MDFYRHFLHRVRVVIIKIQKKLESRTHGLSPLFFAPGFLVNENAKNPYGLDHHKKTLWRTSLIF